MTTAIITLTFKNSTSTSAGEFDLTHGNYSISAFGAFKFSGGSFSVSTLALNETQFMFTPATDTTSGYVQIWVAAATDPTLTMNGFSDDTVSVEWPLAKGGSNTQDLTQGRPFTLAGFAG
jgi:hypothetical protein